MDLMETILMELMGAMVRMIVVQAAVQTAPNQIIPLL